MFHAFVFDRDGLQREAATLGLRQHEWDDVALLEFVEMFKAPIKVLHPLLTATQEGNFKGTEGFDADAYSYSGGLCLANQGLLEFVEMFKAPIKVLHPLLTATQEGNFKGTEGLTSTTASSSTSSASSRRNRASTCRRTCSRSSA